MPSTRRLVLTLVLAATLPALAGCATEPQELALGDCLLVSQVGEQVDKVPVVDCGEPHEAEVYAVATLAGFDADAPYEADAVLAATEDECVDGFEAYVGEPYRTSPLDIFYTYPLEDGWGAGDRGIVCAVFAPDESTGRPLTFEGTLEGSA